MDRKVLWAISILLFLVAVKAWVLVDRWITSEIFHDVQNANRCCAGHATMSTERGSNISANYSVTTFPCYRVKPKKTLSNCCMETLSHWPEMKNSGFSMKFLQKILYLHESLHSAFITLRKLHTDHCVKQFRELPNNISFSFLLQKHKPSQSATIVLALWIYRTEDELKLHFGLARQQKKGACAQSN